MASSVGCWWRMRSHCSFTLIKVARASPTALPCLKVCTWIWHCRISNLWLLPLEKKSVLSKSKGMSWNDKPKKERWCYRKIEGFECQVLQLSATIERLDICSINAQSRSGIKIWLMSKLELRLEGIHLLE